MNIDIVNLLSAIGVSGLLGTLLPALLNRRQTKKMQDSQLRQNDITNDIMVAKEWKEIAEKREVQLDIKDKKIDELYISLNEIRTNHNATQRELQEMKLREVSCKVKLCERKKCMEREPQSGY